MNKMLESFYDRRHWIVLFLIANFVIGVDSVAKMVVINLFDSLQVSVVHVTSFFNIVSVWNKGVSFGILNNTHTNQLILFSITALIVLLLLIYYWQVVDNKGVVITMSFALISGGAVANAIDRIRYGSVFDFLDLHFYGIHYPAFNFADSAITVGFILMLKEKLLYAKYKGNE